MSAVDPSTGRRLRKDAERSRAAVLEAARRLFAQRGLKVGFKEIAEEAGVGVGTAYRRFPTRESLIEAIFADQMDRMVGYIEQALAEEDPWEALVGFCDLSVRARRDNRGLMELLVAGAGRDDLLSRVRAETTAKIGQLLVRAQESGQARADLTGTDLLIGLHLITLVAVNHSSDAWQRTFALYVESIRARPGQGPLPTPAPEPGVFEQVVVATS